MAVPVAMRRMARERETLEKANDDYFVYFDNDNLRTFHAYVIGPKDSLYEHKLVKLKFEIPDRYPLVPPNCTFVQYAGDRIHPNLYVEGKVCLSILGTWAGEPWAYAMTVHTVLITIRSLLDNSPYMHEPGCSDHPAFNDYVRYGTWTWLFTEYLKKEQNKDAREFLERHVSLNRAAILSELQNQFNANTQVGLFHSPYGGQTLICDFPKLMADVRLHVEGCHAAYIKREKEAGRDVSAIDGTSASHETQRHVLHDNVIEIEDDEVGSAPGGIPEQKSAVATANVPKTKVKAVETEVIDLT